MSEERQGGGRGGVVITKERETGHFKEARMRIVKRGGRKIEEGKGTRR